MSAHTEPAHSADYGRNEAIIELAKMVAGIARRCWENLGTDYAGSINERCGHIIEALKQSDGTSDA